jgi:hypothetical protein
MDGVAPAGTGGLQHAARSPLQAVPPSP